jgi:hypothetical protein
MENGLAARAGALLAAVPVAQLIEVYQGAFDGVGAGDREGWMAAARVRGWVQQELQRRGQLDALAVALGVCPACWAELVAGACPECV